MTNWTQSTELLQDSSRENGNLLVIDGDALPYMIGWHHREHRDVIEVQRAVDVWMRDFFICTSADEYLGIIGSGAKCFRYDVYKYRPYKGNRQGEKDEWIVFWEPVIRNWLTQRWGFKKAPDHLETDDVVATAGSTSFRGRNLLICSPDKDLKQIPGYHVDYRKLIDGGGIHTESIDAKQALYRWCIQMLCGDSTDNITGVPGLGPKKADALLASVDEFQWKSAVREAYQKYFGNYYGNIIYSETEYTLTMMTPNHPLWETYGFDFVDYPSGIRNVKEYARSVYSET